MFTKTQNNQDPPIYNFSFEMGKLKGKTYTLQIDICEDPLCSCRDITIEFFNDNNFKDNVRYLLMLEGNQLIAKHHWGEDIKLNQEYSDFFHGNRSWGREIEFIRNEKNKISGFTITGSRIANLHFYKISMIP